MVCPFCQAEITANDKVCPMCGAPVNEQAEEKPEVKAEAVADCSNVSATDPGKTLGLVGMIMGIASLALGLFSCCCCGGILGVVIFLVTSVVSLILSVVAGKKSRAAGFANKNAKIGTIVSAISVGILLIMTVVMIVYIAIYGLAGLTGLLGELDSMY